MTGYTTRVSLVIDAPQEAVYAALVDPDAVQHWRVPEGMSAQVHEFDPRPGGSVRISLTYVDADAVGKTAANTDTYRGRFVELVPGVRTVEEVEFESEDAALAGTITVTTAVAPVEGDPGRTRVELTQEGMPDAVPREDNELGSRMALDALAAYVTGHGLGRDLRA